MGQRRRLGSLPVFLTVGGLVLVGTMAVTAQATGEFVVRLASMARRGG